MELIALSLAGSVAVLFLQVSEFVEHRRTSPRQLGRRRTRHWLYMDLSERNMNSRAHPAD